MILREKIIRLVEDKVAGTSLFLVDVSVSHSNKIIVLADTDAGITVEECIELSRFIENALDRDTEDFELEVSSPGLGQPFKVQRQYLKNVGRELNVLTNSNEKIRGKLLSTDTNGIELETLIIKKTDKNKKVKEQAVIQLAYDNIKSAKVVISF